MVEFKEKECRTYSGTGITVEMYSDDRHIGRLETK